MGIKERGQLLDQKTATENEGEADLKTLINGGTSDLLPAERAQTIVQRIDRIDETAEMH